MIGTYAAFGLDVELELWQVRKLKANVLQQMYEVRGVGGLVVCAWSMSHSKRSMNALPAIARPLSCGVPLQWEGR